MVQGLSVARVVNVDVQFEPVAAPLANFNAVLVLGDSDVVDTGEALRTYNGADEVSGDFGTTAPEYLAAVRFFSQIPQPDELFVGRWAAAATNGLIAGGFLSGTEQLLTAWTGITNGGFHVAVDGGASTNVTGLNFSAALNLNGVASAIQTAVRALGGAFAAVSVIWNGQQFVIKSGTTGTGSTVSYLTPPTAGTDISGQLKMTLALAERLVVGIAAETPVAAAARLDGRGWYGLTFASTTAITDAQHIAVAAYIEAASDKHTYGITSAASNILDPAATNDLASQLALANYTRTFVQYSQQDSAAAASFFGRQATVNFEGADTMLTMKFKQEPGILPEVLNASQADTLIAKRTNVLVEYNNGVAILQEGVMSGRAYYDEILGTDWLANRVQADLFNVFLQSPKIAQTNPGVHVLLTTGEGAMSQGVTNGLMAAGRWNAVRPFPGLENGTYLQKGWLSYAPLVENQGQTDREARKSPLLQYAIKLAGAVHSADVLIAVNR